MRLCVVSGTSVSCKVLVSVTLGGPLQFASLLELNFAVWYEFCLNIVSIALT